MILVWLEKDLKPTAGVVFSQIYGTAKITHHVEYAFFAGCKG